MAEDILSVALLVALFNGNLVLPLKQVSFARFLEAFNARSRAAVVAFIPALVSPTLSDYWLCGLLTQKVALTAHY